MSEFEEDNKRLSNISKSALALFALSKGGYEASRHLDTITDEIDALENQNENNNTFSEDDTKRRLVELDKNINICRGDLFFINQEIDHLSNNLRRMSIILICFLIPILLNLWFVR